MHRISHGFLGKFKTYTIPVPVVEEQTIEQRKVALLEKTKSWVYDPSKLIRVNGYVPQDEPTPTPTPTPAPAFDPDAAAYLEAVVSAGGSVDETMSAATDTLFTELKSNSLYDEILAFYPLLGSTSASTAIMGKRDLGTAYDVNWFGGWIFNVSGATGNASNTYASFNISGGTLPSTNSHISLYGNLPNNSCLGYDLSINYNNSGGKVSQIILGYNGSTDSYIEYTGYASIGGGNTGSFVIMSRDATGTQTIRARNSVLLSNKTEACNDIDNTREWFMGCEAASSGIKGSSTSNRYSWAGFGNKLTEAQLVIYQNIINTFQTTLGRNTY
tara:strand:+ start:15865 stop:16851 length:987 start_codon:yes stop_codon:yes gene_type:complete